MTDWHYLPSTDPIEARLSRLEYVVHSIITVILKMDTGTPETQMQLVRLLSLLDMLIAPKRVIGDR